MLNRMRDILSGYTSTVASLPTQSAAEQTRATWAKPIQSYDAVPKLYKPFFEPFLATGCEFPYTVLAPSFEGFIHRTTEKLICLFAHEICILQRSPDTVEIQCYPIEEIGHVEVRTVLLDSHLKISGVNRRGVSDTTTIRFNSVSDYLFQPIIEQVRLTNVDMREVVQGSEGDKFNQWARSNYKFMNYARRSLLEGERVIQAMLQSEIRARVFTVLGKTYQRTIFPTHASILTDRELILIREELRRTGREKYGGIWDYIPLRKIGDISLNEKARNLLALSIQVVGCERMEYLYEVSAAQEIRQFLERYREIAVG